MASLKDRLKYRRRITHTTVIRLLRLPLVQIPASIDRRPDTERRVLADHLEHIAVHAVRLAAYIGARHGHGYGDQGHAAAVDAQNEAAAKVRAALGFTYPAPPISF